MCDLHPCLAQKADAETCAELVAFLGSGDPPVVLTLGSTAVNNPGNFYEASVEATKQLGCRAVLQGTKSAPVDCSLTGETSRTTERESSG